MVGDEGGSESGGGSENVCSGDGVVGEGSGKVVGAGEVVRGRKIVGERGGDDGRGDLLVGRKRVTEIGAVPEVNVAWVAVLEGAEGDGELGSGLGADVPDVDGGLLVDGFTRSLFEAEVCRISKT